MQQPATQLGAPLYAFGFPRGQEFTPLDGIFGHSSGPGGRWQVKIEATQGMSGGPVVDDSGNVVGVMKGGIPDTPAVRWVTPIAFGLDFISIAAAEGGVRRCTASGSADADAAKRDDVDADTGDEVIDGVVRRLRDLSSDPGDSKVLEIAAALFQRDAFRNSQWDSWPYFLWATSRTRLVVQQNVIPMIRNSPQHVAGLTTVAFLLSDVSEVTAGLWPGLDLTHHLSKYASSQREFVRELPQLNRTPDGAFERRKHDLLKSTQETLVRMGMFPDTAGYNVMMSPDACHVRCVDDWSECKRVVEIARTSIIAPCKEQCDAAFKAADWDVRKRCIDDCQKVADGHVLEKQRMCESLIASCRVRCEDGSSSAGKEGACYETKTHDHSASVRVEYGDWRVVGPDGRGGHVLSYDLVAPEGTISSVSVDSCPGCGQWLWLCPDPRCPDRPAVQALNDTTWVAWAATNGASPAVPIYRITYSKSERLRVPCP